MKEVHEGYITEAEVQGIKCLMFNFDAGGSARVESLCEEFCHHPKVRLRIEDIREPKERATDYLKAQATMAAPI